MVYRIMIISLTALIKTLLIKLMFMLLQQYGHFKIKTNFLLYAITKLLFRSGNIYFYEDLNLYICL